MRVCAADIAAEQMCEGDSVEGEREKKKMIMIQGFKARSVNRPGHTNTALIEVIHRIWKLKLLCLLCCWGAWEKHISHFWLSFHFELIPSNGTNIYPLFSSVLVLIPTNEQINNCRGRRGNRADPINIGSDLLLCAYLSSALMELPARETCVDFTARRRSPETERRGERGHGWSRGKPWRARWREKDVN